VAAQCAVPLPASSSSIPALLEMEPFGKHTGLAFHLVPGPLPLFFRLGEQRGVHYKVWTLATHEQGAILSVLSLCISDLL